jgi:hypothetical protein
MQVIAIEDFEHNGSRHRGDVMTVSDVHAHALAKKGLVRIDMGKDDPYTAIGEKSFASPVAPALPQTIVQKSKRGRPPKHRGE